MQNLINYIRVTLKPYYPETEISGLTRIIAEHITKLPYSVTLLEKKEITPSQTEQLNSIINRLQQHEPIQYILGETEFFGLNFSVNRATLIPRPETEELVELIINDYLQTKPSVLDIGTGSGCIAVALARYLKGSTVSAWDFSAEALEIAKQNAQANDVVVEFSHVDVLGNYPVNKKFDIIVSNPPYVLESEKETMEKNVLDYEPYSALFVPNDNPLLFYERIADLASELLNKEGRLYFEINQAQGQATINMLNEKGYTNISLFKDLSKRDRIIRAEQGK